MKVAKVSNKMISADRLRHLFTVWKVQECHHLSDLQELKLRINSLCNDAIEAEPVRHGRWERIDWYPCGHDFICSACDSRNDRRSNFCPDCGAKMDGGEKNERKKV